MRPALNKKVTRCIIRDTSCFPYIRCHEDIYLFTCSAMRAQIEPRETLQRKTIADNLLVVLAHKTARNCVVESLCSTKPFVMICRHKIVWLCIYIDATAFLLKTRFYSEWHSTLRVSKGSLAVRACFVQLLKYRFMLKHNTYKSCRFLPLILKNGARNAHLGLIPSLITISSNAVGHGPISIFLKLYQLW